MRHVRYFTGGCPRLSRMSRTYARVRRHMHAYPDVRTFKRGQLGSCAQCHRGYGCRWRALGCAGAPSLR
eukprot:5227180-Pleurochrysis_carterae.AAC.1